MGFDVYWMQTNSLVKFIYRLFATFFRLTSRQFFLPSPTFPNFPQPSKIFSFFSSHTYPILLFLLTLSPTFSSFSSFPQPSLFSYSFPNLLFLLIFSPTFSFLSYFPQPSLPSHTFPNLLKISLPSPHIYTLTF